MATKTSHLVRPLVALVALVAAMAAILIAHSASPAHARFDSCTTYQGNDAKYRTCTFLPSGSEDTFEVPEGEFHYGPYPNTIHVVATGAPGAEGYFGGTAGRGAKVIGDLKVTPGDTLYVNVGGAPTHVAGKCFEPLDTELSNVSCIGGFNGGGSSSSGEFGGRGFGGGGGGASDVRTVATPSSGDQSESLNSRLIVAGGGGGSGVGRGCGIIGVILTGGTGGDARSNGGDGQPCVNGSGGTGGDAGSRSEGGLGGIPDGHSGSLGLGGNGGGNLGGGSFGGGGGGGYYGGGSGGSIVGTTAPAGGGGGGSNLMPTGGTQTIATTGPSITITHSLPEVSEPPPGPDDKQACKKGGYEALGFKNQGQCIKAVNANNAEN